MSTDSTIAAYQFKAGILNKMTEGIAPERWSQRPGDASNPLIWVVGDLIWTRHRNLKLLGVDSWGMGVLTILEVVVFLSSVPAMAQRGGGMGIGTGAGVGLGGAMGGSAGLGAGQGRGASGGMGGGAGLNGGGMNAGVNAGTGRASGRTSTNAGSGGRTPSQILSGNSRLSTQLSGLCGCDASTASAGFRNLGQLVAAAHVYNNLGLGKQGVNWADFSSSVKSSNLGKAIHNFDAKANAGAETKKADAQARADLRARS